MSKELICTFEVEGYCQPKQRTVGNYRTPPETRAYERLVATCAKQAMRGKKPYLGSVSVFIEISCAIPQSWSKTKKNAALQKRIFPTHADIDNCIKCLFDGMNQVVFEDDRFVTELTASRHFSTEENAIVTVRCAA